MILHQIWRHVISDCSTTGGTKFDHMDKVTCPVQVQNFSLYTNVSNLQGDTLRPCEYPIPNHLSPKGLVLTDDT